MRKKPRPKGWHFDRKDPVIHPDGRKGCRSCHGVLPKGKRSFCSPACILWWTLRTRNSIFRQVVFDRDKGICAACGIDTRDYDVERLTYQLYAAQRIEAEQDRWEGWRKWKPKVEVVIVNGVGRPRPVEYWRDLHAKALKWRSENKIKLWESSWQADHVHPVSDGGSYFDIENNVVTLCPPCHQVKTKRENRERAARRREKGRP